MRGQYTNTYIHMTDYVLASHVYYYIHGLEPPMRKKLLTSNGISEALSYMNQPKIVQT